MNKRYKILYLEDSEDIKKTFIENLTKIGFDVTTVANIKELSEFWDQGYDIALLDLKVPKGEEKNEIAMAENTIDYLKSSEGHNLVKRTIVYTVSPSESTYETINTLNELNVKRVIFKDEPNWIGKVINECRQLKKTIINFRGQTKYFKIRSYVPNYRKDRFIYSSNKMQRIFGDINSNINSNFIITGESGTGKTLLAYEIYYKYKRYMLNKKNKKDINFVPILSNELRDNQVSFESRLYGYKKGAFTGAEFDTPGLLANLDYGILFFDEFLEIPKETQGKLLNLVQNKTYTMIGENAPHDDKKLNFKVIAATNLDIEIAIQKDSFRNDLYRRIQVGAIRCDLPPLNERKEELPYLIDYYIQELNFKNEKDTHIDRIDKEIVNKLFKIDWTDSNVRGLFTVINDAYNSAVNDGRSFIDRKDIKSSIIRQLKVNDDEYDLLIDNLIKYAVQKHQEGRVSEFLKKLKHDLIIKACNQYEKNRVIEILGVSRSNIYKVCKYEKKNETLSDQVSKGDINIS